MMQAHRPGHLVFPSFVTMPADPATYVEASRSITYTQAWNLAGLADQAAEGAGLIQ